MCGISCLITLRSSHPTPKLSRRHLSNTLSASLEKIHHRGPDASGQWISEDNRAALGHSRLSIIDLSPEASQPFHDPSNTIHAVVNGEIYGYEAIRAELASRGYPFVSRCDSEVVVALYKEYGMSFLERLRGEFALCLYDEGAKFFVAAVDRYGVKPLYYTVVDGRLLIASEAKAFLPFGWQPEWDVQSIRENGWLCDRRTLFQGVYKVLPGHYLTVTSMSATWQHKYWEWEFKDKNEVDPRTEQEMITGVRERLLDAVRDRLRADVPIGIFLSGGIDSSVIAGMVKHLIKTEGSTLGTASGTERMNCFSIKFMDESLDEEPIALRTATHLGVKIHTVEMTEKVFADNLEQTVYHNELAFKDLNTVGKFALSRLTHSHGIKVVLTGEGSDEHFAGYSQLLTDYLREPDLSCPNNPLPEPERVRIFNSLEGSSASGPKEPPSAAWARQQVNNTSFIGFTQYASLSPALFSPWTTSSSGHATDPRTPAVNNALDGLTRSLIQHKWHPLHSSLYIWSRTALANGLLTGLGDRVELAHSVEGRQPFLDHRLTEYVNGLPPSVKVRSDRSTNTFNEKWILKEAARPFVTEEMYKRRKHAFAAPRRFAVEGPVHRLFEGLITRDNVDGLGFLDWEKCKDLVREAIVEGDAAKFGDMILVGQFVLLGRLFGVRKAEPMDLVEEEYGVANGKI